VSIPGADAAPVSVSTFYETCKDALDLELIGGSRGLPRRIREAAINRPGFALTGFFKFFAWKRIQVLGYAEHAYLSSLSDAERMQSLRGFFGLKIPCVIVTRHKKVFPELIALADEYRVPLFRSHLITKDLINAATIIMENLVAPRMKVQGTMIEIMGLGVLIDGKAGMGKSETALGLIRKGAALVSDDITALRVDSAGHVIGSPINVTRYHMEIRGVGIIHVPSLYGVASVREEKKLDLVATLCPFDEMNHMDRSGQTAQTRDILGIKVPWVLVGVAPGRDLCNNVEAAALDHKLRKLGHDAAKELDDRLIQLMSGGRIGSD
jgi:HPr kinase/phosphorylase